MQNVEKYETTYTAYDKTDWSIIGVYSDIDTLITEVEAYSVSKRGYRLSQIFQGHKKSTTVSIKKYLYKSPDYRIPDPKPLFWYAPYSSYTEYYDYVQGICVVDHLGDVVEDIWKMQTRKPYKSWRDKYYKHDVVAKGLRRHKDNVNKIKAVYAHHPEYCRYIGGVDFYSDFSSAHRTIRTHSNIKKIEGYLKEEGEPIPRGKQRNLPNSWDDVYCSVWTQTKSWKHNSKRRKQWKIKNVDLRNTE